MVDKNLTKKKERLFAILFLILILPVFPTIIENNANTKNKIIDENSTATLKTSGWNPGFNYTMTINASYNWIEINETGTRLTNFVDTSGLPNDDDGSQRLNLTEIGAWNFKYFGRVYEYLNVCTNGWMTFSYHGDPTDYEWDSFEGVQLAYIPQDCNAPNMGMFNGSIFLFGCDLDPGDSDGGVYYEVKDTAPNRKLIIEYYWIQEFGSYKNQTFQAIFYENGNIKFQYKNTTSVNGFSFMRTYPVSGLDNGDLINYNNVSIDLLDFTNGVKEKAILFKLKEATSTPLPTPDDDDDDDDEAGFEIGLIIIVVVLVSIGAGVAVIIVLIKKGIIAKPKSR